MKSFKQHIKSLQEVEFNKKSSGEDNFADKHVVDIITHPQNDDRVHSGKGEKPDAKKKAQKIPAKKARRADYTDGDDASVFEMVKEVTEDGKVIFKKKLVEARQAVPIKGHAYHSKSHDELKYIAKDAGQAAKAMQGHDPKAEAKYLDQVNDAHTVLYYRSKGGKQVTKEEADLQELSRKKMNSYVVAADKDAKRHQRSISADHAGTRTAGHRRQAMKRNKGIDTARNKLATSFDHKNEETELQELSRKLVGRYLRHALQDNQLSDSGSHRGGPIEGERKNLNRNVGMVRASDKRHGGAKVMATDKNEETELQELSRKTLTSYIKKANQDVKDTAVKAYNIADTKKSWADRAKVLRGPANKIHKRKSNIKKAVDTLTKDYQSRKEETE